MSNSTCATHPSDGFGFWADDRGDLHAIAMKEFYAVTGMAFSRTDLSGNVRVAFVTAVGLSILFDHKASRLRNVLRHLLRSPQRISP
jgi:hypothetical protein